MANPLVSIIIRTKNEEKWITLCLDKIFKQTIKDIEVVIIDNHSQDFTLKLAEKFPVKIIKIKKFLPGKAINLGIANSKGKYIAILSAHCIPKHNRWLANLVKNLKNKKIAGVYGRQEPLESSSAIDKRDLLVTFGLDHKIQKKDYFFHNANSLIKREIWEKFHFDEKTTNIEDRLWGKKVIEAGYQLAYEPEASVYHHHGIHQSLNQQRCKNIIKIIEEKEKTLPNHNHSKELFSKINLNIAVFLPIRGVVVKIGKNDFLKRCLDFFSKSELVDNIYLLSDNPKIKKHYQGKKVEFILRPKSLSSRKKNIEDVLHYAIRKLERKNKIPDVAIYANYLYPFRPENLVDLLLENLLSKDLDSVIAAMAKYKPHWLKSGESLTRVDDANLNSREYKKPLYQGMLGLGSATYPSCLKAGRLLGDKIGVVPLDNQLYEIDLRSQDNFSKEITKFFIKKYD